MLFPVAGLPIDLILTATVSHPNKNEAIMQTNTRIYRKSIVISNLYKKVGLKTTAS